MTLNFTNFIKEDIWTLSLTDKPSYHCLAINTLKIVLLSIQGFKKDLCQLRASALTLYSLLSIVPVIALLFGVAKGFGFEKKLEEQLIDQSSKQDNLMIQLIEFSQNMLSNTKGGIVAGIGVAVLFWTVIKVIGNIEESFNHIWKIEKNRSMARKLSDYLSLMMLAPLMLIASSSMTIFVKTKIAWIVEVIHLPAFGTKMVLYAMSFSPLLIMCMLFTFLFIFMPNHKIKLKAGIIAGISTGIMYQLVQWAYISLQIGASSYNAIYGSFAALPLFLIWLQLVWIVVLLGCEISFYLQNFGIYQHNEKFSDISFALKKTIALQVCHYIVHCFADAKAAPKAQEIARHLKLPISIVQRTLGLLLECRLIVALNVLEDEENIYQPAMDIEMLTVAKISHVLETMGRNELPEARLYDCFNTTINPSDNALLKEIKG